MSDAIKDQIGHYELLELVGDGAQGKIFKARCVAVDAGPVACDELVALKVLRVPPDDERANQRFENQANILKQLSHPHIIRYRDSFTWHSGEWDEAQCLVMEYLEGETPANRLKTWRHGLPWPEAKIIFEQCLAGLICAGQHGIIHRDVKPSNIFITRDGSIRIFDFDIARDVSGTVTSGGIPVTLDYMAPEFAFPGADRGTAQSDLYSLGLCLYEALAGQTAFVRLPDGDMAGSAKVIMTDRRKRAIRAAVVILVLVIAGAVIALWWSRVGRGMRPVFTPVVAPAPLPVESDNIRAAREELNQIARSVRIPIADAERYTDRGAAGGDQTRQVEILSFASHDGSERTAGCGHEPGMEGAGSGRTAICI